MKTRVVDDAWVALYLTGSFAAQFSAEGCGPSRRRRSAPLASIHCVLQCHTSCKAHAPPTQGSATWIQNQYTMIHWRVVQIFNLHVLTDVYNYDQYLASGRTKRCQVQNKRKIHMSINFPQIHPSLKNTDWSISAQADNQWRTKHRTLLTTEIDFPQ